MAQYEYHIVRASWAGSILSVDEESQHGKNIAEYANTVGEQGFECAQVTPIITSDSNGRIQTNLHYVFRRQR